MKTENLIVDQGSEREVVEEVGEILPHVGVAILSETFIVKAINLSNLTGLVVSSKDSDALGVSDFESDEEGDGLDGVVSSIDVIT